MVKSATIDVSQSPYAAPLNCVAFPVDGGTPRDYVVFSCGHPFMEGQTLHHAVCIRIPEDLGGRAAEVVDVRVANDAPVCSKYVVAAPDWMNARGKTSPVGGPKMCVLLHEMSLLKTTAAAREQQGAPCKDDDFRRACISFFTPPVCMRDLPANTCTRQFLE
jgi:hypothetical protein